MAVDSDPGLLLEGRGQFGNYRVFEAPSGYIAGAQGDIRVEQGEIQKVTTTTSTDGATSCLAFMAITEKGDIYIGHSEGDTFTTEQEAILKESRAVLSGSPLFPIQSAIGKFPNITTQRQIETPDTPEGMTRAFSLLIDPKAKMILYDWYSVANEP